MQNFEFRLGLRMAMEAVAQEQVDRQIQFMDRSGSNAVRLEILRELQGELERVHSLDICSPEPLNWWLGTNYCLESLWTYMPEAFRSMFSRHYNSDLRRYEISADVEGEMISFVIQE